MSASKLGRLGLLLLGLSLAAVAEPSDYSNAIFELPDGPQAPLPQPVSSARPRPNLPLTRSVEAQLDSIKASAAAQLQQTTAGDADAPTCRSGLCGIIFGRTLSGPEAEEALEAEGLAAISSEALATVPGIDLVSLGAVRSEKNEAIAAHCPRLDSRLICVASRQRHPDGRCNNVRHPWWGSSGAPLRRLLPPRYEDGVSQPPSGLPSPVGVSAVFAAPSEARPADGLTLLFPSWAHLLRDDVVELAQWKAAGRCVDCKVSAAHSQCLDLLRNDADCATSYTRLVGGVEGNCRLGPKAPANLATATLDGSALYGSTRQALAGMRLGEGGLLRSRGRFPDLHPQAKCAGQRPCFLFGHQGGNYLANTAALSNLLLQVHNNLAQELAQLNTHWDDERLFATARRIVEASLQHVTYSEYLPLLLGRSLTYQSGLGLSAGFSHAYAQSKGDGLGVSVAAATAALPFYQTMLSDRLSQDQPDNIFFHPDAIRSEEKLASVWGNMLNQAPERVGLHLGLRFDKEVMRKELAGGGNIGGAILLQWGRDAGTPSYVSVRRLCGLPVPETFEDLITHSHVSVEDYLKVKAAYEAVEDVDLLVGGLAETASEGAAVGPTFQCLLSAHYADLKNADRFWYENYVYPSALSTAQLAEVRKVSLAWLVCRAGVATSVQPKAFQSPNDFDNAPVGCDKSILAKPDLGAWLEVEVAPQQPIDRAVVEKSILLGRQSVEELEALAAQKAKSPSSTRSKTSAAHFHSLVVKPDHNSRRVSRISQVLLEASKLFFSYSDELETPEEIPAERLAELLPTVDVSEVMSLLGDDECRVRSWPCDPGAKWRSFDGWCNNIRFPDYGIAGRRHRRLLSPVYQDGFNSPRSLALDGSPLPSPRAVSNAVHSIPHPQHTRYSHMLMQWGQFLDHDFALTPHSLDVDEEELECEPCDSAERVSHNCFPIPVPQDDPFFPPLNEDGSARCLPFSRSMVGQLRLGYREQLNQLTSAIDASNVYGSDSCVARQLRTGEWGLLKTQAEGQGDGLLPPNPDDHDCRSTPRHVCFRAGDSRVNEHAGLGGLHTVSVRAHNRLAQRLRAVNPHWDDERLYQEARRIVAAAFQHITYQEWLPKILGHHAMHRYGLQPLPNGHFRGYDDTCDLALSNMFATAAFRFGHTLIQGRLAMMDPASAQILEHKDLVDLFFNSSILYEQKKMKELFMGFARQPCAAFDATLDPQIRDSLFEEKGKPHSGLDLAALNIQRGRDHGLPSYTAYREALGLSAVKTWDELASLVDPSVYEGLRSVYSSPEDVDVFPGLMSERRLEGAVVGETLAAALGEQFARLRRCDRFWYENGGQAGSFSAAQLRQVRRASAAWLVCQNMDKLAVQPELFVQADGGANAPVPCGQVEDVDLGPWRDVSGGCSVGGARLSRGASVEVSPCVACVCTGEGVRCHSFRVGSCRRLLAQHSARDVLGDAACVAQCHALLAKPHHRLLRRRRR